MRTRAQRNPNVAEDQFCRQPPPAHLDLSVSLTPLGLFDRLAPGKRCSGISERLARRPAHSKKLSSNNDFGLPMRRNKW
jgi:hypothetical protein